MSERYDGRNYWQRMKRSRMSRRAILRASGRAGVGAAGLALVGCGDDDDDSVAQVGQQQQQQQQAMQQQAMQQQQQQAMQQEQQEQAADQAAQQADQQEQQAVADAQQQQQQQAAAAVPDSGIPAYGGVMRRASTIETHDYWDPHRGVFGPTQFMHSMLYNNLIRWKNKEKSEMEADIASVPENPDAETYIFNINPNARWHDAYPTEGGRNITAEDIVVNVDRNTAGVDSTGAEDGSFLGLSSWRKVASVDAVDDLTLRTTSDGVDSTYLSATFLRPFGWMAAPEGIREWGTESDVWRDDPTTLRVAGSGPFIAESYEPTEVFIANRNPNYWKDDAWGQQLPYVDRMEYYNLFDETAIETAVRSKELDGAWLNISRVESLLNDFPQMQRNTVGGGFTIMIRTNYNPDWPGEDGEGNPWLDRRVAAAFHLATDRYLMIDTVYLGSAKPSVLEEIPWFSTFWSPTQEEMTEIPGFRADHEADIREANELMDASGFRDSDRSIYLFAPDVWEQRYPGIVETAKNMYESALGVGVEISIDPYTILLQRLVDGTSTGQIPCWTNPPSDLDPTSYWLNGRVPGGSANFYSYENPRVTEIAEEMKVTLDFEAKGELSREMVQLQLGIHPDYGWESLSPGLGVMNPVSNEAAWPWYHVIPDGYQFAHQGHKIVEELWLDTAHEDYPA